MSQTLLNYQQVLEQLQVSADKIADVTILLEAQSELVIKHNEDREAHAYLQDQISNMSTLNSAAISLAIANHNASISSHPELRALIDSMIDSDQLIDRINEAILAHDSDPLAHPAIRDRIDLVNDRVDSLDIRVTALESDVQNVRILVLSLEEMINSGIGGGGGDMGIDMAGLIHGFPDIVAPGSTHTVSLKGISAPSSGALVFTIIPGDSGLQFSKTANISANENITVTVPANAVRGRVDAFRVAALYTDTVETGHRIVPFAINRLPVMSNARILSLPAIVKPNSTHAVTLTGSSDPDGQTLKYSISSNKNYVSFSKSSGLNANQSFNVIYSSSAIRGETPRFTITVNDGLENNTRAVDAAKVNTLPVVSGVTITGIPAVIKPNSSATIKVTGATDPDAGQSIRYSISCDKSYVTFNKTSNISANENIVMTYSSSATRGETPKITITVTDGLETATKVFNSAKVNTLPTTGDITATGLTTVTTGGTTYTFKLSGGSGTGTLIYNITGGSGLNLTPTSNISANTNIVFTPSKVSSVTSIKFTVYAVDSLGETSSSGKQFTVTVNPIFKIIAPTILSPTNGQEIRLPYDVQTTAYETYVEL